MTADTPAEIRRVAHRRRAASPDYVDLTPDQQREARYNAMEKAIEILKNGLSADRRAKLIVGWTNPAPHAAAPPLNSAVTLSIDYEGVERAAEAPADGRLIRKLTADELKLGGEAMTAVMELNNRCLDAESRADKAEKKWRDLREYCAGHVQTARRAEAEAAALRVALEELERTATTVASYTAMYGQEWPAMVAALVRARAALAQSATDRGEGK